jgi:hypothetical protein
MNTVPQHLVGRASALSNVIRQIASAFGIAMFSSILANRQTTYLADLMPAININSDEYLHLQAEIMSMANGLGISWDSVFGMTGSMIIQKAVKESMVMAMGDCFIVAAGLTVIALVLAAFFKGSKK